MVLEQTSVSRVTRPLGCPPPPMGGQVRSQDVTRPLVLLRLRALTLQAHFLNKYAVCFFIGSETFQGCFSATCLPAVAKKHDTRHNDSSFKAARFSNMWCSLIDHRLKFQLRKFVVKPNPATVFGQRGFTHKKKKNKA